MEEGPCKLSSDYLSDLLAIVEWLLSTADREMSETNDESTDTDEIFRCFLEEGLSNLQSVELLIRHGHTSQAASIACVLFELRVYFEHINSAPERAKIFASYSSTDNLPWSLDMAVRSNIVDRTEKSIPEEKLERVTAEILGPYEFFQSLRFGFTSSEESDPETQELVRLSRTSDETRVSIRGLILLKSLASAFYITSRFFEAREIDFSNFLEEMCSKEREAAKIAERLMNEVGPIPEKLRDSFRPTVRDAVIEGGYGSASLKEGLSTFLTNQVEKMELIIRQSDFLRLKPLGPLFQGIGTTAKAMATLASEGLANETLMLARALFKRTLNAAYLIVADEQEVENYVLWAKNRTYRGLTRTIESGEIEFTVEYGGEIDVSDIPGLEEAVDRFTSKNGKPKGTWTEVSRSERIEKIIKRSSLEPGVFSLSELAIFGDASEALHGTLYGATVHLQGLRRRERVADRLADWNAKRQGHLTTTLFLSGMMVTNLIQVVADSDEDEAVQARCEDAVQKATGIAEDFERSTKPK